MIYDEDDADTLVVRFRRPKGPLPSANRRLHWTDERHEVHRWTVACRMAWNRLPKVERDALVGRRCAVQLRIPVPDRRKRDPHNYVAPLTKALVDQLVRSGLWPDDTPEWVTVMEPVFVYQGEWVELVVRAAGEGVCPWCAREFV